MSATKNKLIVTTPSDREIRLEREFDAPRSLVFEVWNNPEHVRHWWGCRGSVLTVCEIDLRVGGAYRFVMSSPEMGEHPFKGVFREIVPPERLVHTQIYDVEPYSQFEAIITVLFEDIGGRTKVTSTILHQTTEARDGHLNAGMEFGAGESYDQLEETLERLQQGGVA